MESEEKNPANERFVDDEQELPDEDQEFNLEGEFHEDDLASSGALVCSTPAPAAEIPAIVVDEAQEQISSQLSSMTFVKRTVIFRPLLCWPSSHRRIEFIPGAGVRVRARHLARKHGVRADGQLQAAVPEALRAVLSVGDVLDRHGRLPLQRDELLLLRRRLRIR